jgi:hypothetical protein
LALNPTGVTVGHQEQLPRGDPLLAKSFQELWSTAALLVAARFVVVWVPA